MSENLDSDGIKIALELTLENKSIKFYSYNVSVSPQVALVFTEEMRVQFRVPYDTPHIVSIQATLSCGHGCDYFC